MKKGIYPVYLFWIYVVFWALLAINPVDRFTWFLENILVFVSVPLFIWTYHKARLSNASYTLITIFMILHTIGSHYTYSETPFFSQFMGHKFQRDHYDRLTHFTFGLLLVYPLRELLIKFLNLKGIWRFLIPWLVLVSLSGLYELVEWSSAYIFSKDSVVKFMGAQGDIFDSHKDMMLATIGALITLSVTHFKSHKKSK